MPLHRVKLKRTTVEVTEVLVDGNPLDIERSLHSGDQEIWEHADVTTPEWESEVTATSFQLDLFVGIADPFDAVLKLGAK